MSSKKHYKINEGVVEVNGILGYLLALPIMLFTFGVIAALIFVVMFFLFTPILALSWFLSQFLF